MLAAVSVMSQVARAAGTEVRPPGSEAERAAARRLVAWLRARGDAAEVRPRRMRPQALAATGIGAAVGAAGSLVAVASAPAGLACAAPAAVALALEAAGMVSPARWLFPPRELADVWVAPRAGGDAEGVEQALLVCAPFGSPRLGLAAGRVERARWWLAAAAAAVLAACAARALGAGGVALGAVQLVPTLALLAGAAAALDAGLAGWGPGEAAAAALAAAVHDELAARPPGTLVPALLLFAGPRPRLAAAAVIAIRPGAGLRAGDARTAAAAERAAEALGVSPPSLPRPPRGHVAVGAEGEEAAVDLALAVADALDQAQTSSPRTTSSTP
jgi:hypothetical protein